MRRFTAFVVAVSLVASGASLTAGAESTTMPSSQPSKSAPKFGHHKSKKHNLPLIVDTLRAEGNFTKVIKLIESAGFEDTLNSDTSMTFFAPTDEAFANMSDASMEEMMVPGNRDNLRLVLLTHTLPSKRVKATLFTTFVENFLGKKIHTTWVERTITLDGAAVITQPDIKAGNGVIHGISAVLQPK